MIREVDTLPQAFEKHLDIMYGESLTDLRQKGMDLIKIFDFFQFLGILTQAIQVIEQRS
jgi:hypothetical protein